MTLEEIKQKYTKAREAYKWAMTADTKYGSTFADAQASWENLCYWSNKYEEKTGEIIPFLEEA